MAPLPVSLLFANFLLFQCAGFIFVVVALFCFVFLAASLPVTKSGRKKKKASKNVSFAFFYSFAQTIIGLQAFPSSHSEL